MKLPPEIVASIVERLRREPRPPWTPGVAGELLHVLEREDLVAADRGGVLGFDFSTVVRVLEREGNGAWPRKTLLRRVRSTSRSSTPARGQNGRRCRAAAGAVEQLERVAKTPAGPTRWARLEAAAQAAEYDTPAYHEAIRAMHASPDNPLAGGVGGPCGCYSCSPNRRRRAA